MVLPAIQQINAPEAIKITLTLESSLGEIIAVLTVGTLMGLDGNQSLVEGLITGFGHHVLIDVAVGIAVGVAWSRVWPLIAGQQFGNRVESRHGTGRVRSRTVARRQWPVGRTGFGLTLAEHAAHAENDSPGARMLAFHSELTFLVRSFFFVVLGIMAQFVSRAYAVADSRNSGGAHGPGAVVGGTRDALVDS